MQKIGFALILALIAGALVPIQTGANTALSNGLDNVLLSTFVVFLVASLTTFLILIIQRPKIPPICKLMTIPWFAWLTGGILGSGYIYLVILTAPKLGMATVLGIVIIGKIFTAMAIDHFGWLSMKINKLSFGKILGAIIMLVGITIVKNF